MISFFSNISEDELKVPIRNFVLSAELNSSGEKRLLWNFILALCSSLYYLKNILSFFKAEVIYLSDPGSRILINGKYYDQIFDLYMDEQSSRGVIVEIPSIGVTYSHINSYEKDRLLPGGLIYVLQFLYEKLLFLFRNRKIKILTLALSDQEMPLPSLRLKKVIISYWAKKSVFKLLFQFKRPHRIVLKSSYSQTCLALISAAKYHDIPVEELQHSHIYDGHYGYFYGEYLSFFKKYFMPTLFRAYDNFYSTTLQQAGWICSSEYLGNPYYRSYQKNIGLSSGCELNKYDILIVSQHNLIVDIANWLANYLSENPDMYIAIKCHPRGGEEVKFYKQFFSQNNNVEIINAGSIYKAFSLSSSIAGVYSSALVDGMSIGLPVFVIPLEGSFRMKRYIDEGLMSFLQ